MGEKFRFFIFSLVVFLIVSGLSVLQYFNLELFTSLLGLIKTPSSWFISLSLAFVFSNFLQNALTSFFLKKKNLGKLEIEPGPKGDFFEGFLATLLITSLATPYLRQMVLYFFENLFPYFHVIILQSILVIYFVFKVKNNYPISGKHLLVNELIVLINTGFILYFLA